MQRERRRDPYPWTWEPALVVGVVVVMGLACGVQLGRSLAHLLVGAGWTWPDAPGAATTGPGSDIELLPAPSLFGGAFWRSVPQVLAGDSTAGLARPPDGAAGSGLVWGCVSAVELLVMVALVWAAAAGFRRWGPGRVRGMATRVVTEQLLGVTRMRSVAAIVRPDLYGANVSRRADGEQVHLTASSSAGTGGWSSIRRTPEGIGSQAPPSGRGARIELGRGPSSEFSPLRRRRRRPDSLPGSLLGSLQRWLGWGRGDS
jgi:hypothetical protein